MVAATVDSEEMLKLEEYSKFMSEVLGPDYIAYSRAEEETRNEILAYQDLEKRLQEMRSSSAGQAELDVVDLGHRKVFCRATIDDTSTVFVHVGMGFHAELSIEEALVYVTKRVNYLTGHVLPHRAAKSKTVLAHIQSSERILDELANDLRRRRRR
jgi:prefoldin subunit 5